MTAANPPHQKENNMRHTTIISSLLVTLTVSCGGEILQVDEEPASSGGRSAGDGDAPVEDSGRPCDVFESQGHTCVAAHSTVRLLRTDYEGPLYQLCRGGDAVAGPDSCEGDSLDIGTTSGGYADAAAQSEFCPGDCKITIIYDQSGHENHLEPSPPGSAKPTSSNPASASALPVTINGRDAFGLLFRPEQGYRAGCNGCSTSASSGIPVGDEPETIYMVTSNVDLVDGCCFNYGNGSTSSNNDGNGTAEAVYFGQGVIWGTGSGPGPWVMADLENGLYPGWENGGFNNISTNTSLEHAFVTAVVVGDTAEKNNGKGRFALYGGNAQEGALTTMYDGIRPERPGYVPMMKQGSVLLSIGSDNSNGAGGRFYEGAIAIGAASKDTLDEVQAAITAAKYGQ